ncbi:hypothetical protein Ddye_012000 [Dipteronia dyeriana]|uniref:Transposase MuDR plant domain-containing protein n=1 Tax=Dipteronia dyeriana TaxID=168575 RepID=A0AAD9X3G9_9ROSI|nr:hypothetical protein Ddye_012000 [Dipteronia dyeriana]
MKNERNRITCFCDTKGCSWRVYGSPIYNQTTYMLKTLINKHNRLVVSKNKDVTSAWIGKKFETLIKENLQMNIEVLSYIVLRSYGVNVPKHTLYRAKRYSLDIGFEDHKQSYNKLNNPGSSVGSSSNDVTARVRQTESTTNRSSNSTRTTSMAQPFHK